MLLVIALATESSICNLRSAWALNALNAFGSPPSYNARVALSENDLIMWKSHPLQRYTSNGIAAVTLAAE